MVRWSLSEPSAHLSGRSSVRPASSAYFRGREMRFASCRGSRRRRTVLDGQSLGSRPATGSDLCQTAAWPAAPTGRWYPLDPASRPSIGRNTQRTVVYMFGRSVPSLRRSKASMDVSTAPPRVPQCRRWPRSPFATVVEIERTDRVATRHDPTRGRRAQHTHVSDGIRLV
jgi:hypothetical protein